MAEQTLPDSESVRQQAQAVLARLAEYDGGPTSTYRLVRDAEAIIERLVSDVGRWEALAVEAMPVLAGVVAELALPLKENIAQSARINELESTQLYWDAQCLEAGREIKALRADAAHAADRISDLEEALKAYMAADADHDNETRVLAFMVAATLARRALESK
jgi:hypothetical protein